MDINTLITTLYLFYTITTAQNPVINVPRPPPPPGIPHIITRLNTPAPTFGYINPFCVPQEVQPIIGSRPPVIEREISTTPTCYNTSNIAIDLEGVLQCENYACCLCKSIQCGIPGVPCEIFVVNDHGAIGAQSIIIDGGDVSTSTQPLLGAAIECSGKQLSFH